MRICYVCKAVDETDPTVATQVRWIRELAARPQVEHLHVLARSRGPAVLPSNVSMQTFGREDWPRTIVHFLQRALAVRSREVDLFFVAQGGPYPALLLPIKLARGKAVYQWKAHAHVSSRMRFYARVCDDLVFTPTLSSLPLDLPNIRVVGHGIDTQLFRPDPAAHREGDLVAIGRIAPVKRLHVALEAMHACRATWGRTPKLDIVGPCQAKDEAYHRRLVELVEDLGLAGDVRFLGSVTHEQLPALLATYRASINFSDTAFDKAAGESMAVGVPVITTNDCTTEMLPPELRPLLAVAREDEVGQARLLHEVTGWEADTRLRIGSALRDTVVQHHSLDSLFDKILEIVEEHLSTSRTWRSSLRRISTGRTGERSE